MDKIYTLPKNLISDCVRIGYASLNTWFNEHEIVLSKSGNWIEKLALSIAEKAISTEQLEAAISELDENSDKKIFLMQATNFEIFNAEKSNIINSLRKKGIILSDDKYINGQPKSTGLPTFVNFYWEENLLKIKYTEFQYINEPDFELSKFIKTEKRVNIIYVIDTLDGFCQIRMDTPGTIHSHKSSNGKSSDSAYEAFYKNLLSELFVDIIFNDLNLNAAANKIVSNEIKAFRINKEVTTISNGAKQTYSTASIRADIRNLRERVDAGSDTTVWLTEDLTGYWVAAESNGELKRDLFMRISRRYSHIRVQRGCLETELNYGIAKIRSV